ncbi:MAG: cytochrome c [Planctomycetes bacterium]|nr:cytochrome c [Planctomycetota bacterium]
MSGRDNFFYTLAILLASVGLWRTVQGQFIAPDAEPVFVAANEFESMQHAALEKDYGKFTQPLVPSSSSLSNSNLNRGRDVYAVNCLHCHGSDGRAQTPTASLLTPPPTNLFVGPVRDVETVLRNGIASTAMSSFAALSDDDFNDVRDYAKYLVERGAAWKALMESVDE